MCCSWPDPGSKRSAPFMSTTDTACQLFRMANKAVQNFLKKHNGLLNDFPHRDACYRGLLVVIVSMSVSCSRWQWDWQAVDCSMKDVWKSTTMVNGEQSVMMTLTTSTPQLLARVYLALGKLTVFWYIGKGMSKCADSFWKKFNAIIIICFESFTQQLRDYHGSKISGHDYTPNASFENWTSRWHYFFTIDPLMLFEHIF